MSEFFFTESVGLHLYGPADLKRTHTRDCSSARRENKLVRTNSVMAIIRFDGDIECR